MQLRRTNFFLILFFIHPLKAVEIELPAIEQKPSQSLVIITYEDKKTKKTWELSEEESDSDFVKYLKARSALNAQTPSHTILIYV